jgi:serine/threonine protein kinase
MLGVMGAAEYPQPYGEYVLLERLGVGGMSEVDLARKAVEDTDFVRFVVIKRIKADLTDDESFIRMFKDEARITAELHHNNIANVYDFGRQGDEYYMALEYVPGTDLRRIINTLRHRHKTIPLRIGLKVLADVLSGLGYAHDQVDALGHNMNIVHRDVNPRNVMISTRGEVKLIDFGVAKATNRLERTRTDHVKGKFAYMAPEQITAGEIDHRADLFAVGLLLHEIVTGYGPLAGLSQVQIMHRLMAGRLPELPPPSELADPGPLQQVYRKAIEVKPEDRYPSGTAFRRDLEKVAEPLGGLATQKDVVEFLQRVDPALEGRLREKASSYSGPLQPSEVATAPLPRLETLEPVEGSLSGVSITRSVTRSQIVAGSMFLGAGLFSMVAAVSIVVVVGVVIWASGWWSAGEVQEVEPSMSEVGVGAQEVPGEASAPKEPQEVAAPEEPGSVPTEEEAAPAEEAAAPALPQAEVSSLPVSPPPEPSPPTPVPEPSPATPEPSPRVAAPESPPPAPAPDIFTSRETRTIVVVEKPASEVVPDSEPVETIAPPPPAEPLKMGMLQVTSPNKGSAITINGVRTPYTTPATFDWVVGTHSVEVDGATRSVTVREGMTTVAAIR